MAKRKPNKNNAGSGSNGKAKTLNNSIPPTPSAESGPPSPGGANAQAKGKNKNNNGADGAGAGGRNGTANDSSISIPLTPSRSNELVPVSPVAANATTTNQRASSQEPQSGFVSPPLFQTPPTSPSSPAIDARLLEDLLLPDPMVPLATQEQATEAEIQHTPVAEVVSGDANDTSEPRLNAKSETPLPAADAAQDAQTPTPKTQTGPEQDLVPIQNASEEQQPIVNDSPAEKEDMKIDPPLEAETETDESGANKFLAVDHGVGSGQDEGVPQDAQPTASESHPSPGTDELPVVGPQGFYIDLVLPTTPTGELSTLEYEEDGKIDLGLEMENQGDASGGDKTQVDEHVVGATGDGGVFQTAGLASEAGADALPPADLQVEGSHPAKLLAPTDPAGITDTINETQVEPKTIAEDSNVASVTQSPAAEDESETTPTVVVTLATPTQEGPDPDAALPAAPTSPTDPQPLVQKPEVIAKADPPSGVSNIQDDLSGTEELDAKASAGPIPPADPQTPVREPEAEADPSAIVSSAQADPSGADVVEQDDLPPSPPQTDIGVEDIVTQFQDLETSADHVQADLPQSRESEARAEESKTPVQATQIPTPEASPDTERAEGRVEVGLKAESPLLDDATTTDSGSGEGALSEDESTHASAEHPATTEATSEAETMPEAPEEDTEEELDLSEETTAAQAFSPTSTPVKPTEIQTPPSPASTAPPSSQPSPPTAVAPLPPISAQDIASGNQDIIAIANLFATMKKTVVSMKTAFDRIGTQAERMVSYSLDVHTAEQVCLCQVLIDANF